MKTIELTEEELQAFRDIYDENALYEYLDYEEGMEEPVVKVDRFSSLFKKLGINLEGENNV